MLQVCWVRRRLGGRVLERRLDHPWSALCLPTVSACRPLSSSRAPSPPPLHTGNTLAPRSEGIHCTTCYTANLAPACSACGNKIVGGVFRIKGKPETFCSRACWDGMVKEGAAKQRIPEVASKRGQRKQQTTDGGASKTKTFSAPRAGAAGTAQCVLPRVRHMHMNHTNARMHAHTHEHTRMQLRTQTHARHPPTHPHTHIST